MNLNVVAYLLYLALALPLTFSVARTLHRYGKVFLLDVFTGNEVLANAVNQLLVTGFYLLNLGYVALFMTSHADVTTARRLLEVLSVKIGAVALVIGAVHFGNVWLFNSFRRRAVLRSKTVPPVAAPAYPPVPQGPYGPGSPAAYPPPAAYRPPAAYPPPGWPGWSAPGAGAPVGAGVTAGSAPAAGPPIAGPPAAGPPV